MVSLAVVVVVAVLMEVVIVVVGVIAVAVVVVFGGGDGGALFRLHGESLIVISFRCAREYDCYIWKNNLRAVYALICH